MQVIAALLSTGCFAGMIANDNLSATIATNFAVKFLFGVASMSENYVLFDINYFGTSAFARACSITSAVGLLGGVIGTVLIAFTPPFYVVVTAMVVSAVKIPVVISMTEVVY